MQSFYILKIKKTNLVLSQKNSNIIKFCKDTEFSLFDIWSYKENLQEEINKIENEYKFFAEWEIIEITFKPVKWNDK